MTWKSTSLASLFDFIKTLEFDPILPAMRQAHVKNSANTWKSKTYWDSVQIIKYLSNAYRWKWTRRIEEDKGFSPQCSYQEGYGHVESQWGLLAKQQTSEHGGAWGSERLQLNNSNVIIHCPVFSVMPTGFPFHKRCRWFPRRSSRFRPWLVPPQFSLRCSGWCPPGRRSQCFGGL